MYRASGGEAFGVLVGLDRRRWRHSHPTGRRPGSVRDVRGTDPDDDPVAFARRLQTEVEAAAAVRRRREPELARLERDIERAWTGIAPPGAVGEQHELLLDRAERLSYVDVDVDVGTRRGVSQVKRSIRKLVYWYLRYVADQLTVLHNVIVRLLRRMDERLEVVEDALDLSRGRGDLVDPPADLGGTASRSVAELFLDAPGPVAVVSCAEGAGVAALAAAGVAAYGVDVDAERIVGGSRDGLDLRPGDPVSHLESVEPGALGGVILRGIVEDLALPVLRRIVAAAESALAPGGVAVVAVDDPTSRPTVDREIRAGRGVSPQTWAYLLERSGFECRTVPVDDHRIGRVVVATRS